MLALAAVIALASCGPDLTPASTAGSGATPIHTAAYNVRTDAGAKCDVMFTVPGSSSCTLNLWPAPVIPPPAAVPPATMIPTPVCGYTIGAKFVPPWVPCPAWLCTPIVPVCTNFAPANGAPDNCTCTTALAPPGGGFTGPSGIQTEIGDTGWWIDVGVSCKGFRDQVWTCPPPSTTPPPVAVVVNAPFGPGPQTANLTPSMNACASWLDGAEGQLQAQNQAIAMARCAQDCPGGTLDSLGPDPQTNPNPFYSVTPGGPGGCTAALKLNLNSLYRCHNP
jgi:hypothetical protein